MLNSLTLNRYTFRSALVIILVFALIPSAHAPETGFNDKINHVAAFLLLALLACREYLNRYLAITAGLITYGVFIEIAQLFMPGRTCSIIDLAADFAGIAAGIILDFLLHYIREKRSRRNL